MECAPRLSLSQQARAAPPGTRAAPTGHTDRYRHLLPAIADAPVRARQARPTAVQRHRWPLRRQPEVSVVQEPAGCSPGPGPGRLPDAADQLWRDRAQRRRRADPGPLHRHDGRVLPTGPRGLHPGGVLPGGGGLPQAEGGRMHRRHSPLLEPQSPVSRQDPGLATQARRCAALRGGAGRCRTGQRSTATAANPAPFGLQGTEPDPAPKRAAVCPRIALRQLPLPK
ncbi:hypothetical protein D3C80_1384300 [compost metagenome]